MSGISEDLPVYLKSKFSVTNPPSPPKRPLKSVKSVLTQGVSSDSPIFFQLGHVSIVNDKIRIKEISGNDQHPGRFLSGLKQNRLSEKPKFNYADSQFCDFDYHSLKPSSIIDLAADKSPKIKESTKFRQEFNTYLQKGFGKARGQFTIEAMQAKVPRYEMGQMEFLKTKLNLSHKNESRLRATAQRSIMNQTQFTLQSTTSTNKKSNINKRRISTPQNLSELDEFDKRQESKCYPVEARKMYSFE
jgi:hypothetical protein